ncbi:hypothetical protein ACPXB3_14570 [Gordonia sp. DT219]|uniref:hypothetical protein n=1 Tax=Gordonia sp. DT219 TaxID=3416658 RepID=UPI003CF5796D
MQTTGTQDGLTFEWSRDGHLVALGHPTGSTEPIDLAQKDNSFIAVRRNEVFSPDEVIALFTEYLTTDTIDTTHFSVREIAYGEDADENAASAEPTSSISESGSHAPVAARHDSTATPRPATTDGATSKQTTDE